ncbi:hypothetical protein [Pseudanabaena mucicola]|uniref:Uncharacterized protein n=1 Tax=Pseudanabaena mucicola FACHB-723 TaxID=2692860 RepID=A0ABR7ZWG4_9CYAN|nr:hypothetical protein [Pseudanabaena mucicola]MBD2188167.1 hypothetical protein [Pseudanabaena mucicola FACHB-723]
MPISLPENLVNKFQTAKGFVSTNIDAALNAVSQNAQQAKNVVLDNTAHSLDGLRQVTETTKTNLTKAADSSIGGISQKIDVLNQTLAEGIKASVNAPLNNWINHHPQLIWIVNHPLQSFGISMLLLVFVSGLLGAIADITKKFWLLILTYPFTIITNLGAAITKPNQMNQQGNQEGLGTNKQKRTAVILSRLEANRQEQILLLKELESLLR